MREVVEFLEALGRTASLRSEESVRAAVMGAGLASSVKRVVLDRDVASLGQMLGGRATMMCNILLPENDEPRREDAPDEQGDEPGDAEARMTG